MQELDEPHRSSCVAFTNFLMLLAEWLCLLPAHFKQYDAEEVRDVSIFNNSACKLLFGEREECQGIVPREYSCLPHVLHWSCAHLDFVFTCTSCNIGCKVAGWEEEPRMNFSVCPTLKVVF